MSESSTKTKTAATKKKTSSKKTAQKHDLLYIMSNSCGWCKKADPVVQELVNEGHKITTLDVMNPDESKRANEVKQKFNAQCGTPLFIDAETGNMKCGFAEKDVIEKWAKGEEIPKPPQPKSPPPPPPTDLEDEKQIEDFTKSYEKWKDENDHLPNLLTIEQVIQRLKNSRQQQAQQPQQGMQPGHGQPNLPTGNPMGGQSDFRARYNTHFYYIIENGKREVVMSSEQNVKMLKQQYYFQEQNGQLTKVVGDPNWGKDETNGNLTEGRPAQPAQPAGTHPAKANMNPAVNKKIDEIKKEASAKKDATNAKSKTNKKIVKGL